MTVLRAELDLTGIKCGRPKAPSVIIIESLQLCSPLPLPEAFLEIGAMQWGYCTPGTNVTGTALLQLPDLASGPSPRPVGSLVPCYDNASPTDVPRRVVRLDRHRVRSDQQRNTRRPLNRSRRDP